MAALVEATGTPMAKMCVWFGDVPKDNWVIVGGEGFGVLMVIRRIGL
jgi:hypothetical protein